MQPRPNKNGINQLDKENTVPARHAEALKVGMVHGNYFYVGDKPGGVEPGFLAFKMDQNFYNRLATEPEIHKNIINKPDNKNKSPEAIQVLMVNYLKDHPDFSKSIAENLKAESMGKIVNPKNEPLPLLLFKQDYDGNGLDKVAPPIERIMKTNAIRSLPKYSQPAAARVYAYARQKDPEVENTNAILECLANDIARAHGMPVQEQSLAFGTYESGRPKILTACKWERGLEMIEGCLAGSTTYDDYYVQVRRDANGKIEYKNDRPVPIVNQDGYMQVDHQINNLGEYYALFLMQGDRDVLGSKGQNKGRVGNELFGFDFGHAYRESNIVNKTLSDDFSFTQPSSKNEKFKNMSVFNDSLLSEKMLSVFYSYQTLTQKTRDALFSVEEQKNIVLAIEGYKKTYPNFKQKIERLESRSVQNVFTDYKNKFTELANQEPDPAKKAEYQRYVNKIEEAEKFSNESTMTMLTVFKNRMVLQPEEINFLDNLEKLTSATSSTSPNGKVLLSHLRIQSPDQRVAWEMKKNNQHVSLTANVPSNLNANDVAKHLSDFLKIKGIEAKLVIETSITDRLAGRPANIKLNCDADTYKKIVAACKESNIKKFKQIFDAIHHPKIAAPIISESPPKPKEASTSHVRHMRELIGGSVNVEHLVDKQINKTNESPHTPSRIVSQTKVTAKNDTNFSVPDGETKSSSRFRH